MNTQREKVFFFFFFFPKDGEVKWARVKVQAGEGERERERRGEEEEEEEEVQNGRCTGQKSPNENGPLRQKLMTGDQKSKISIQHFELFRVAGHPFALQMPLLSIPLLLSLHSSSLSSSLPFFLSPSRAREWPCLRVRR